MTIQYLCWGDAAWSIYYAMEIMPRTQYAVCDLCANLAITAFSEKRLGSVRQSIWLGITCCIERLKISVLHSQWDVIDLRSALKSWQDMVG